MENLLLRRKKIIKRIELNRKVTLFLSLFFSWNSEQTWIALGMMIIFLMNYMKITTPIENLIDKEIKLALEKEELQFKTKDGKIWITDGVTDLRITQSKYEGLIFNREI